MRGSQVVNSLCGTKCGSGLNMFGLKVGFLCLTQVRYLAAPNPAQIPRKINSKGSPQVLQPRPTLYHEGTVLSTYLSCTYKARMAGNSSPSGRFTEGNYFSISALVSK